MPLYPLLVAPFVASGLIPGLVIFQALIGAAAPALAFALAAQLFDRRVGLLTAFLVAVDPYAVVHDAAFQETVVLNVLVLLAVLLLSRAAASRSAKLAVGAGMVLSLAVFTTARIAPLAGLAVLWIALGDGLELQPSSPRDRSGRATRYPRRLVDRPQRHRRGRSCTDGRNGSEPVVCSQSIDDDHLPEPQHR